MRFFHLQLSAIAPNSSAFKLVKLSRVLFLVKFFYCPNSHRELLNERQLSEVTFFEVSRTQRREKPFAC